VREAKAGLTQAHTTDGARANGWSAIASNHEAIALCFYLVEHDGFGKQASTFPDRALTAGWVA
jgi:hypothetical protein